MKAALTQHRIALINLANGIRALVERYGTGSDDLQLGSDIDSAIKAGYKATVEGEQTNQQSEAKLELARKAFYRQVARRAKR